MIALEEDFHFCISHWINGESLALQKGSQSNIERQADDDVALKPRTADKSQSNTYSQQLRRRLIGYLVFRCLQNNIPNTLLNATITKSQLPFTTINQFTTN